MSIDYSYPDVAKMIDHSLLNPALKWEKLEQGITLALAYDVASVCILPYALSHCVQRLRGSGVKASTTIGFRTAGRRPRTNSLRPGRHSRKAAKNSIW